MGWSCWRASIASCRRSSRISTSTSSPICAPTGPVRPVSNHLTPQTRSFNSLTSTNRHAVYSTSWFRPDPVSFHGCTEFWGTTVMCRVSGGALLISAVHDISTFRGDLYCFDQH
jgi:hypothetical protein